MNKLTKIQFTTFIDIISQDNYRAPLYCDSAEQGIERKGLISLHKDRSFLVVIPDPILRLRSRVCVRVFA